AKTKGARAGYVFCTRRSTTTPAWAYTEELADERGATAAAFWARAVRFFHGHGIRRIRRVLTDNGACCPLEGVRDGAAFHPLPHKRTRPYRPQTNGKVERFHRTLAREWAYARAWSSNAGGSRDSGAGRPSV